MQAPKSRSPSRRARSANAATVDSSLNTMSWKPAYGRTSSAKWPFRACAASQSKRPPSTRRPPIATPWPPMNFVAEWNSRSAP